LLTFRLPQVASLKSEKNKEATSHKKEECFFQPGLLEETNQKRQTKGGQENLN
jgi:hypothetical protein